jgi:uncharacterized membrane protein YjfL (UPF0719 family)
MTSNSWKTSFVGLVILVCSTFVGYATYRFLRATDRVETVVHHEISGSNCVVKMDSLNIMRLENLISNVAQKNDGRFEVLTWATVLIITFLAAFITINFIMTAARVKEIVDEKITEKTGDLNAQIQKKLEEVTGLTTEAEQIKNTLTNLMTIIPQSNQ